MTLRVNVTFVSTLDTDCPHSRASTGFRYPFPELPKTCYFLSQLLASLPFLFKPSLLPSLQLDLVQADSYSSLSLNDSSMLSLVMRGQAQLTMQFTTITFQRWQILAFLPPITFQPLLVVWKIPKTKPVSLNPPQLLAPNLRPITALLVVWTAAEYSLGKRPHSVLLHFSLTLYFDLLSSHITNIFNRRILPRAVIQRDGEFQRLLKSGGYRAYFASSIMEENYGTFFTKVTRLQGCLLPNISPLLVFRNRFTSVKLSRRGCLD